MTQPILDNDSQYKKIKSDHEESKSALTEIHKEFKEYDDFYLGKHWSDKRVDWRPDPVINYVSYLVDQKAPQLTNNKPTGIILPTAQGDEQAAKLFTQVTDVIMERVDFENKLDDVVRTGLLLGIGWFKVYWDNSLTGGSLAKKNLWKGDICIESVEPANMYHDPAADEVESCRYIIYAPVLPIKRIQEIAEKQFGLTGIEIKPDTSMTVTIYDRPGQTAQRNDCAVFYEYWYKENGQINVIYAAGGQILKRIENVFKHGKYPFIPFIPKKKRKSLIGIGEPKNILSNQKLLNKLIEMPTTSALFTTNPILLVKENNGIDYRKVSAKPGQVYGVRDISDAMKWMEPPANGADVYKLIEYMIQFIEKIGGVYDAVTGETPQGVTAASAIQLLQEQGSIPIKGLARSLNNTIKDVFQQVIELVKEFYQETRYIRILGDDGSYQFQEFLGSAYAELDLDVKVTAGSSTPTSKAYIAQLASDLFAQGVLLPSEYVEMQEGLPNKDRIINRLRQQESQQQMQQQMEMQAQAMSPTQAAPATQPPQDPFMQLLQQLPPEEQQAFMTAPPEQQQAIMQAMMGGAA